MRSDTSGSSTRPPPGSRYSNPRPRRRREIPGVAQLLLRRRPLRAARPAAESLVLADIPAADTRAGENEKRERIECAALAAASRVSSQMPAWIELERDGVRLACCDYGGTGPAALLLHGLAGFAGEWAGTARWLTAARRVLALDQRGHGRGERRPADTSRSAFVADAAFAIEQLDLAPVALVGHSMGGNTAFLTCAEHPHLVERLVVAEASPDGPVTELPARIAGWLETWPVPFASRRSALDFFDAAGLAAHTWAASLEERDDGLWPRFERDVMVACIADLARRDYWREWRTVYKPTLVLIGEYGALPLAHALAMSDALAAGRAEEIAGAGHDVHLDAPASWRKALEPFLSDR
jgi:pimeloyl-ACP methyl ester carboxylesterase